MAEQVEDGEDDAEQRQQEIESLTSIYGDEMKVLKAGREYLVEVSVVVDGEIELVSEPSGVPPVCITHLPNLTLYVRCPDDYPSQSCPVFHLSARWLSGNQKHMASLRENLEALYTPGWPVVFEWISYLSNELAREHCKLQQNDTSDEGVSSKLFLRSVSQRADIVAHDEYQKHQLFLQETHECVICCEMKQGKLFSERCQSCEDEGGLCCRDCLAHYCETLVQEGLYAEITCPNTSCTAVLPDSLIKNLLPNDTYQRYLRLHNDLELDCIPGMVFCPRVGCGARVVSDPSSDVAVCQQCSFPFCKLCKQTWHGIEPCSTLEKLEKVEAAQNEKVEAAQNEKGEAASKRSDEEVLRRIEELKSAAWMRSHDSVKPCPKCSFIIQKSGGCNYMVCWRCKASFCWLCGRKSIGYEHFDDLVCSLFRNRDYLPPRDEEESEYPDQEDDLEELLFSKCPRCEQVENKPTNNNWIRCRRCAFPFCHLCKEPCFGRYHFSEYGCKEFTTFEEDKEILTNKQS